VGAAALVGGGSLGAVVAAAGRALGGGVLLPLPRKRRSTPRIISAPTPATAIIAPRERLGRIASRAGGGTGRAGRIDSRPRGAVDAATMSREPSSGQISP